MEAAGRGISGYLTPRRRPGDSSGVKQEKQGRVVMCRAYFDTANAAIAFLRGRCCVGTAKSRKNTGVRHIIYLYIFFPMELYY
jgi:hypothetical protein